jgi:hypothetical protein
VANRQLSRRDFLRLRHTERGKVLELSCRTLFMRLSDASASRSAAADAASDFQQYEPWMGEPPASFDRRSADEMIAALEQELEGVQVLRLLDPEWLDSSANGPRVQAAVDAFRARGGVVER